MSLVSPLRLVGRPLSKMSLSRKKYHTEREKRKAASSAFPDPNETSRVYLIAAVLDLPPA
jgi:hypothetical protein